MGGKKESGSTLGSLTVKRMATTIGIAMLTILAQSFNCFGFNFVVLLIIK
jgi:hypothetical protein